MKNFTIEVEKEQRQNENVKIQLMGYSVRERERSLAFQLGMPGFSPETKNPRDLKFLSVLRPPVENHLPLYVVSSVSLAKTGRMDVLFLQQQKGRDSVNIFPNLGDLADYLVIGGDMAEGVRTPRGIVVQEGRIPFVSPEQKDLLRAVIEERLYKGVRRHDKRLYLVEGPRRNSPLSKEEIKARKTFLYSLGLAAAEVHQEAKTGLVWVTGRPQKRTIREGVDLTQQKYIGAIKREVEDELEAAGWMIVNWEEIEEKLKASKFPTIHIQKLKMGWGTLIQGPCGKCLYRISIQGAVIPILPCDEESCQGNEKFLQELVEDTPLVLGRDMPYGAFCGECGEELQVTRIKGSGSSIIREIKCPHHGLIG